MGRGDAHARSSLCREVGHLLGEMRVAQMLKNPPSMQEAQVRSLGQEDPQENSTDRAAWQATVHGVTKSQTRLSY